MTTDDFLNIDNYFQRKLSEEDKNVFDERLAKDTDFAEKAAFYLNTKAVLRENTLQTQHNEWSKQHKTPASNNFLKFAVGMAAMLALVFSAWFFIYQKASPETLADAFVAKNFTKLPTNMDATIDSLNKGVAFYNEQKYEQSLEIFKQLKNVNANKYAGQAAFQLKNYDEAIKYFEQYAAQNENTKSTGNFLAALAYLKKGEKTKAIEILKKINENDLDLQGRELLTKITE